MIDCDPVLRHCVLGVYAADQLPTRVLGRPYGFIANTQERVLPGDHWCAFYDDGQGHTQFFDSYGRLPRENSDFFRRWINKNAKTIEINRVQIQSYDSTVCGLYCIMFLRHLLAGSTMNDFVKLFDPGNTDENDSYIYRSMTWVYSDCFAKENGQTCTALCKKL